ncbi:hypothetical protein LMH87_003279 [Akanthomyces muscarius]|uniref:Uncharacterized protein n=1 Tax=Akanthomyces muscarius TaxID=2231603 RepID=A0A9W8Q1G9_AKAMU|nr:hypothetical protein LMH87_003279 [Akanthomyces muscarius]KAJ4144395.1 hypothetical protein LMH87_003279 [Akanthomyces muscarius]
MGTQALPYSRTDQDSPARTCLCPSSIESLEADRQQGSGVRPCMSFEPRGASPRSALARAQRGAVSIRTYIYILVPAL